MNITFYRTFQNYSREERRKKEEYYVWVQAMQVALRVERKKKIVIVILSFKSTL